MKKDVKEDEDWMDVGTKKRWKRTRRRGDEKEDEEEVKEDQKY